jgi:hypothetical protein
VRHPVHGRQTGGAKAKGAGGNPRQLNEYVGHLVQNFKFRGDIWGEQGCIPERDVPHILRYSRGFIGIALMRIII